MGGGQVVGILVMQATITTLRILGFAIMDRLLTIDQVSELLQVKKNTIYSWTFTRKIPYVKINGALRFKEKAISRWVDEQVEETKEF
jgi:excisionase family DNA binding protein